MATKRQLRMRAAAALLLALPPPSAAHFFGSAPGAAGADAAGPRRDYRQEPGVYGVDFKYYMKNNTVGGQEVGRGVTVRSWSGGGSSCRRSRPRAIVGRSNVLRAVYDET